MSSSTKWACSQCTYGNFCNSIKCTMCGRSKTLSASSDITCQSNMSQKEFPQKATEHDEMKWSCLSCTYSNFSSNQKCIQCLSEKSPLIIDEMKMLSISDSSYVSKNDINLSQNKSLERKESSENALGAAKISPQQSPKNSVAAQDPSFQNLKWICRGCTYENWPRSSKCIMCATAKGSIPFSSNTQPARLATPPPPTTENIQASKNKSLDSESISSYIQDSNFDNVDSSQIQGNINEMNKINNESKAYSNQVLNISAGTNRLSPPNQQSISLQAAQSLRQNEDAMGLNNYETERILRKLRRRLREADMTWLDACIGVVENNYELIHNYLSSGGDPMRQLTKADVKLLARPSAFDEGHTLVHLAIRFQRENLLETILSRIDGSNSAGGLKKVPSFVAPDLAADVRRQINNSIKQRKGNFSCHFVTDFATFSLPSEIEELPSNIQEQLFEELLDRDVQKQLEEDSPIINWSLELTNRLSSRLYALWNRSAGDCLLDSLLQAAWCVFDREGTLRRSLAESMSECSHIFYPRWKEYERLQARMLNYNLSEHQMVEEWAELVMIASQPGAPLEQVHIFVLSHILRRPIIVYGVKCVKSFRGDDLGYARFEGVYLPFLWEKSFCWKTPLALGYTRGHFSALVPMEPETLDNIGAGAILQVEEHHRAVFFPLMAHDGKLLSINFLPQSQLGREEEILRAWMDVGVTEGRILVAQVNLAKPLLLVAQMTQEWINYYKRIAQMECAPFTTRPISTQGYLSDGDSEEE